MLCSMKTEILTNYSFQSGFYFDNIYTNYESCEFSNKNFATS